MAVQEGIGAGLEAVLARARQAQGVWAGVPLRVRLGVLRVLRQSLADAPVSPEVARENRAEFLAAEVLPLCDACRFLEREAPALLRPRRLGRSGRPAWLWGVTHEVRREPLGVVLVVGPANYPLLLPGVHLIQALAAGNAVLLKPGVGGTPALQHLLRLLRQAGLPEGLVVLLSEAHRSVPEALAAGVDKVILTGSLAAGRAVLPLAAEHIVPAVAELSGDDPCVVCRDADLRRVARALAFARRWNDGNTCIAPRRVIVVRESAAPLREHLLREGLGDIPLSVVQDLDEAVARANASPFALGAAVFGPERTAVALAARILAAEARQHFWKALSPEWIL